MNTVFRTLSTLVLLFALTNSAGAQPIERQSPHAVTMWWVIFNDPGNCYGSPDSAANCTTADVFGRAFLESVSNGTPDPSLIAPNMDAGVAVLYATGGITGELGSLNLAAALYKTAPGITFNLPPGVDPMGFGRGLESNNAEIHLVIRDHGDVSARGSIAQTTNFLDPYCSDPNLLYLAGPNLCTDVQFAVYGPDETGSDTMHAFSDPALPVRGARAHLSRHGDVVRAVIRTSLSDL